MTKNHWLVWVALAVIAVGVMMVLLFWSPNSGPLPYYLHAYILNQKGREEAFLPLPAPGGFSGTWKTWDRHGQMRSAEDFRGGKLDGIAVYYNSDGTKTQEIYCSNGASDGPTLNWDDCGKLRSIVVDKNGSTQLVVCFWPSGQLKSKHSFKSSHPDGVVEKWDEQGRLEGAELWEDGKCVDKNVLTKLKPVAAPGASSSESFEAGRGRNRSGFGPEKPIGVKADRGQVSNKE